MRKIKTDCNFDEMPVNLIKLKKLTEALDFSQIVRPGVEPEIKELKMDKGTSYMVGLYKAQCMAVARNYASAGCEFPEHVHDEWELLVVYQGEMHLIVEGKERIIKEKEFYYLMPGTRHGGYFPKETWFLAITMPANENWPEGG
jgi:quercetin dioxygenase-like cupin family protein